MPTHVQYSSQLNPLFPALALHINLRTAYKITLTYKIVSLNHSRQIFAIFAMLTNQFAPYCGKFQIYTRLTTQWVVAPLFICYFNPFIQL